jgi:hypothetical protein
MSAKSQKRTCGPLQSKIWSASAIIKSFLLTCGIFCGGYVTNTMLDTALEAAESYFHVHAVAYKIDTNGYVICTPEKPKYRSPPTAIKYDTAASVSRRPSFASRGLPPSGTLSARWRLPF